MSEGIAMRRCAECGHVAFPPRALCPRCGASTWQRVLALAGTVEEVTRRWPRRDREEAPPGHSTERYTVHLASVRTDLGPVITVRGPEEDLEQGMRVTLESEASPNGVPESAELRARPGDPGTAGTELTGPPLPGEWSASTES